MKQSSPNSVSDSTEYELVLQFNPVVGRTQWKPVRLDYDYAQEIAVSGYGDMLHDEDRNRKYAEAVQAAVKHIKSIQPNTDIHVLDIGTGTGLLSMMAATQGVQSVTACDAFRPMAECARQVLKENKLDEQIKVIGMQSTKLSIPEHMPQRANLLIAELVDTELIGEACLSTYKNAAECLLTTDATLVPYGADLYCQIVESPFLWSHHRLHRFEDNVGNCLTLGRFGPILHSEAFNSCAGSPSVFDIQASEMEAITSEEPVVLGDRQLRCLLTQPVLIKRFNFSPPANQIRLEDSLLITHTQDGNLLTSSRSGTAHAFIVWWRMKMEPSQTVADISTAPSWAEDPNSVWRDHWMQGVFFPRYPQTFAKGQPIEFIFRHDLLSLWFDFPPMKSIQSHETVSQKSVRPVCECGLHYSWPRTRIAQMQTVGFRNGMVHLISGLRSRLKHISSRSVRIVVISDCSLLPIFLSENLGSQFLEHHIQFDHIETSSISFRFFKSIYDQVHTNATSPSIQIWDSATSWIRSFDADPVEKGCDAVLKQSVLVVAEPFAVAATLPWDAMHFWYAFDEMRTALPRLDLHLYSPLRLRIWAVLMDFDHLWKIRSPIGSNCEGFDLTAFDRLVQPAMRRTHALVEPQPLWEYRGVANSEPRVVFDLNLNSLQSDTSTIRHPQVQLKTPSLSSRVNGIAFWCEWFISQSESDTDGHWYAPSGPSIPIRLGMPVRWNSTGVQQGVTLFPTSLCNDGSEPITVPITVTFYVHCGEFQFQLGVPNL